jgi:large subunit ribosomal protein L25
MKSLSINGTKRAAQTKQETKQLRAQGMVPCVLYGGTEQIHFSAPALSFKSLVYSPEVYTVDLNIDGQQYKAIMQDLQFHSVNDRLIHIDFLQINENKPVVIDIPVKLTGSAKGVKLGGVLLNKMRKLKISAMADKLPDNVTIAVDDLDIGDAVRVRDMKVKGVEFLDLENNSIVAVKTARAVEPTPEEVAAATTAAAPAAAGAPAAGAPAAGAPAAAAAPAAKK